MLVQGSAFDRTIAGPGVLPMITPVIGAPRNRGKGPGGG